MMDRRDSEESYSYLCRLRCSLSIILALLYIDVAEDLHVPEHKMINLGAF